LPCKTLLKALAFVALKSWCSECGGGDAAPACKAAAASRGTQPIRINLRLCDLLNMANLLREGIEKVGSAAAGP
jgi:hypothetical protein